jgi:tetratricopeptide (TPR) repeat protein
VVNQEKLIHIAQFPHEINAADARELEELTRKFPYFSLPYTLLGHYYALHKDYRMEENLHQAALRTFNRSWLHAYIHQTPAVQEETESVPSEQILEVAAVESEETAALEHVPQEVEIAAPSEQVLVPEVEALAVEEEAILPAQEIATEETAIAVEAEPLEEHSPATDALEDALYLLMPEFTSRIIEPATSEDMELEVFEEIQEFEVSREPKTESAVLFEEKASADNWSDLPDLMLVPVQEKAAEDEVAPIKVAAAAPILYTAGGYNIEDYFPADAPDTAAPTDFFSWLSKPTFHEEAAQEQVAVLPEENADTKMDLIDRFIKAKPSIRKPAATFFNPMESAKRSETLPDGIVTETLACVYLKQENFAGAIRIYEKLMLKFPEKSTYFAGLIDNIKKEHQL